MSVGPLMFSELLDDGPSERRWKLGAAATGHRFVINESAPVPQLLATAVGLAFREQVILRAGDTRATCKQGNQNRSDQ